MQYQVVDLLSSTAPTQSASTKFQFLYAQLSETLGPYRGSLSSTWGYAYYYQGAIDLVSAYVD